MKLGCMLEVGTNLVSYLNNRRVLNNLNYVDWQEKVYSEEYEGGELHQKHNLGLKNWI